METRSTGSHCCAINRYDVIGHVTGFDQSGGFLPSAPPPPLPRWLTVRTRTTTMFSIYHLNLRPVHLFNLAISKFHHTNQYFKLEIFTSCVVSLEFTI